MQFRLICYPARGNEPLGTTTRMSAHSDSGSVTLLFQTCPGLEVESPTGEWVPGPHLPGHILVNLGDALAFWSGGRLKATKHRVTFAGVPHDVERMTMAYFGAASPETVLQPIDVGGPGNNMESYEANGVIIKPGITVGEYGRLIMENIYVAESSRRRMARQSCSNGLVRGVVQHYAAELDASNSSIACQTGWLIHGVMLVKEEA